MSKKRERPAAEYLFVLMIDAHGITKRYCAYAAPLEEKESLTGRLFWSTPSMRTSDGIVLCEEHGWVLVEEEQIASFTAEHHCHLILAYDCE